MRFFRIPSFTGIETHRDDADRGSLRTVEGCIPHGPGGLRSGPVWDKIGEVTQVSNDQFNQAAGADDDVGNSALFVSRNGEVHDMMIWSKENTALVSIGANYPILSPGSPYWQADANITPIGNRLYAVGDGSVEASYVGDGPPDMSHSVFPDETIYSQEWARFTKCQFYVQGPRKTIYASGNPSDPLVVYVSEPAGMTQPVRDNPYSTPHANETPGIMSQVRILSSNATKITALSTRGDKVLVHTDKGCHLLLAPSPEQASTGYRTEQVASTNTSAAVNNQVVAGDGGTQPFWLGFDGAIYKDSAAARGAEDFKSYSDPQQASWKSKGRWEQDHPNNLENSFATYDPQSGMYWVFIESEESPLNVIPEPSTGPTGLSLIASPADGPSGLSAVTIPANGPTGLSAIQPPPASGPTDLSLLTAPASGPTGLGAVQPIPSSGPTSLSAVQPIPSSGPTGLSAVQAGGSFQNSTHTVNFIFPYTNSNTPNFVDQWTVPQGYYLGGMQTILSSGAFTDWFNGNLTVSIDDSRFEVSTQFSTVRSTQAIHHSDLPIDYTLTAGSESCVVTVQAQYNSLPPAAPVSGPTGLSAVQPFDVACPSLHRFVPGSGQYSARPYFTQLNWPTHANNFGYQSFQNVPTPTTLAEMNATGGSGSTCFQAMTMYFPFSGSRFFLRNNGVCNIYQHWLRMDYEGVRNLDTFLATASNGPGDWDEGNGYPSWHFQEVVGATGGVWDVWLAAGNDGIYKICKRLGSHSVPFTYSKAGATQCSALGGEYVLDGGSTRAYVGWEITAGNTYKDENFNSYTLPV